MKILNKLIKLLGGYTKDEYNKIYFVVKKKPIPIIKETPPIKTLKVSKMIPSHTYYIDEYERYVIKSLHQKIADAMFEQNFTTVDRQEIENNSVITVTAKIVNLNEKVMWKLNQNE